MSLTSAQIVTLATQIAKAPGYTVQAGYILNSILRNLCQNYDFETIVTTYSSTFVTSGTSGPGNQYIAGCGPNPMPSDYLRCKNNEAIFYIQGVRYVMINLDQAQFDRLVQTAGLNDYPQNFYVDMGASPPNLYVWMPASGAYPFTIRYYPQKDDITTPETSTTVPWFPDRTYLYTRVAGELCKLTNDDRWVGLLSDQEGSGGAGEQLRKYLKLKDDPEGRVDTVKLDRRIFGRNFNTLPNTKQVGW